MICRYLKKPLPIPASFHLSKTEPQKIFIAANVDTLEFEGGLQSFLKENQFEVLAEALQTEGWTLTDAKIQKLLQKIRSKGVPLGEYVNGKIYRGVLTGLNEAFVIDRETRDSLIEADPKSAEIIKPFLAGRDIKRYQEPRSDKFLILIKAGDTKKWFGDLNEEEAWEKVEEKYPAVMRYLKDFEVKAKARYDKGNYWWELRACDYYDNFEKEKIILPDISIRCEALIDKSNHYTANTAYVIPGLKEEHLALLNSSLLLFFYSYLTQTIRGGYFRFIRQYLVQLPIADINEDFIKKLKEKAVEIIYIKSLNHVANTRELEKEIDQLVYQLYGLTEEKYK